MNIPNPAIVSQAAVQRLPRAALVLLVAVYVLAGFVGRDPWRGAELASYGVMSELASGGGWPAPEPALLPQAPLPHAIGALSIRWTGDLLGPALASRLPFIGLLALTLAATWSAAFRLTRTAQAQPVMFAFGGEAQPTDYARAMADAALLALVASLGLAQFSHEATPALAQLAFVALMFAAASALRQDVVWPRWLLPGSALALALSGAPVLAAVLLVAVAAHACWQAGSAGVRACMPWRPLVVALVLVVGARLAMGPGTPMPQWPPVLSDPGGTARLLVWFTWPTGLLALWSLWSWRSRLSQTHIALPTVFAAVVVLDSLTSRSPDRSLLAALPPLAVLAALALPTLRRGVAALIDWFALLFFSVCALAIWVVWSSLHLGWPEKPASNVAKLAPGFEAMVSPVALAVALASTLAWVWLVWWRASRHRAPIWKSLVLPAAGASLCWVLLMSLCLPLLNHARSDTPLARALAHAVAPQECIAYRRIGAGALSQADLAVVRHVAHRSVRAVPPSAHDRGDDAKDQSPPCPWLLLDARGTRPDHLQAPGAPMLLSRPTDRGRATWWLVRLEKTAP